MRVEYDFGILYWRGRNIRDKELKQLSFVLIVRNGSAVA